MARNDLQFYQDLALVEPTPEQFTAGIESRWHQPWSEPVRQKFTKGAAIALMASGLVAPVLNPETQITQTYESRWHQSWSEPVRPKYRSALFDPAATPSPFIAAPTSGTGVGVAVNVDVGIQLRIKHQYQALAYTPFTGETITVDKWFAQWREPVRQKPGLGAHLQQALIATTLDPDTQITQGFESKWHYAWSEPVRVKPRLPEGEQHVAPQVFGPPIVSFAYYNWLTEPVRQKPGLGAHLQQALIAPVLEPNTEIIQDYESRWHYAWSEPVRLRRFPVAQQQAFAVQPPSFEVITADKWVYPWSEPVRRKPGLLASSQQFLALDTAVIPVSTLRPWFAPLSEPVRQKSGLRAHLQQAFIGTVLNPNTQITQNFESRWHYPWSEPVRLKIDRRLAVALASSGLIAPVLNPETQIIQNLESRWHYPWSEPVRLKPGLLAALQEFYTQDNINVHFPEELEPKWHQPWSEPVRFLVDKSGLRPWLQQSLAAPTRLIPNSDVIGALIATEQGDLFLAAGTFFNQVGSANVGLVEVVPQSALVGIQIDIPSTSANVGAITLPFVATEYVTEDGFIIYVAEDGTVYVTES